MPLGPFAWRATHRFHRSGPLDFLMFDRPANAPFIWLPYVLNPKKVVRDPESPVRNDQDLIRQPARTDRGTPRTTSAATWVGWQEMLAPSDFRR
jgi:hypothetical protein